MNSWDEDPNERLRRQWQQRFADFEVQLSRRILTALAADFQHQRTSRMVTLLLFLLPLGADLVYPDPAWRTTGTPGKLCSKGLVPLPAPATGLETRYSVHSPHWPI